MRLHDLPNHKLEFGKSPLSPNGFPRAKRTHAANQMKRVQRANGSLAQSGARSPSVFPRGKHGKVNRFAQKRAYAAPPTPFPVLRVPSYSVGIAIKKRTIPK